MSIPLPAIPLEGHCSTIDGNTLYVLSPGGLQSLELKEHAQWSKEAGGVSVTGPACVKVVPNGDESQAALWVIGGTSDDASYNGMQSYSFASKSWETISTPVDVMQGRTNHSASYLEDSQAILVYAGSQQNVPTWLSSETFLVSTQPPYNIQAFTSDAPPANLPILQPWNTSYAVMVGGSELNTQVFTFSPDVGWQPLPTDLTGPLPTGVQGTIIDGSDGSKVLEVYDMSVSPNNVTQIVLLDAGGLPAATGQTVGGGSTKKRKRGLTLTTWPAYNPKNAPTAIRTDCSVAQGPNGLAVIAGGNSATPVAMFNQDQNSWIDASKFFDSKHQQPLKASKASHISTPTSSPTKSSSPTSTAKSAAASEASHNRMMRTLGITLGVLCGIAALFILVLIFLRRRKQRLREREGYINEKNNDGRLSFADRGRGPSFLKETGAAVNEVQPPPSKPWHDSRTNSNSSLAIITGKFRKSGSSNHAPKQSSDSTARLVKGIGEPVEMVDISEKKPLERRMTPRYEPSPGAAEYGPTLTVEDAKMNDKRNRSRSSGWSKYFATSQPTGPNGLSHLPSAYVKSSMRSDGSAYSNDNDRIHSELSRIPSSAMVGPLDIQFGKDEDGHHLSHVATGSPSFNDSREDLAKRGSLGPEGQKGVIVDPHRRRSEAETISSYNRSTMSSNMTSEYFNEFGTTPWTPTNNTFKDHLVSRPPSSVYPSSIAENRMPSRGKSAGFFPGAGTTYRPPPKAKMSSAAAPSSDWAAPAPPKPGLRLQPAEDRDSNVTVFPRGVPSAYYAGRQKEEQDPARLQQPPNSDLAWVKLGLNGSQTRL